MPSEIFPSWAGPTSRRRNSEESREESGTVIRDSCVGRPDLLTSGGKCVRITESQKVIAGSEDLIVSPRPFPRESRGRRGGMARAREAGRGGHALGSAVAELVVMLVGVVASSAALYFVLKSMDPNAAQAKQAKQKKKEIARRLGKPMIQTNQYEVCFRCWGSCEQLPHEQ